MGSANRFSAWPQPRRHLAKVLSLTNASCHLAHHGCSCSIEPASVCSAVAWGRTLCCCTCIALLSWSRVLEDLAPEPPNNGSSILSGQGNLAAAPDCLYGYNVTAC